MGKDDRPAAGTGHQRRTKWCCLWPALEGWNDLFNCHCCWLFNMVTSSAGTMSKSGPQNPTVRQWGIIAKRGRVSGSLTYPLPVSGPHKTCPTSFIHLSRQNSGPESAVNRGSCSRISRLLSKRKGHDVEVGETESIWAESAFMVSAQWCLQIRKVEFKHDLANGK